MSSKKFKSQASSSRAAAGAFGAGFGGASGAPVGFSSTASLLSYVSEPPDFSQIYDPQVVVAFKLLQKKDSTTKAKALEDIQSLLFGEQKDQRTLEDGLLDAWIKLFPRTAIDNGRRVRQLAFQIHGLIVAAAGKRIAKQIPNVIGIWLAGLYDTDKPVQRAALESFEKVFTTDEKRRNVWKAFQTAILEFAEDALIKQTPATLSDERTVSPDDAEAKHVRVVGTAGLVLNRLIFVSETLEKDAELLEKLLSSKKLWEYTFHTDAFVRRSIYSLLTTCAEKQNSHLDWKLISAGVLGKATNSNQLGSAQELSKLLLELTERRPSLWTTDFSGKTSALKRLCQYLKKGSQGSGSVFWENVVKLLQIMPNDLLADETDAKQVDSEKASTLMAALHDGVLNRDDTRADKASAWGAYCKILSWLCPRLASPEARSQFLQERAVPLIEQSIMANPDESRWTLPASEVIKLSGALLASCVTSLDRPTLKDIWLKATNTLVEEVKVLPPEQSKSWKTAQDRIMSRFDRLYKISAKALAIVSDEEEKSLLKEMLKEPSETAMSTSIKILEDRNGKPYGAAGAILSVVQNLPSLAESSAAFKLFLAEKAGPLARTPSGPVVIAILNSSKDQAGYHQGLNTFASELIREEPSPPTTNIHTFLSSADLGNIDDLTIIEQLILKTSSESADDASLIQAALANPTLPKKTSDDISSTIATDILVDDNLLHALKRLDLVSQDSASAKRLADLEQAPDLHARLLYLTESSDREVADIAASIEPRIKEVVAQSSEVDLGLKSAIHVIQRGLYEVGRHSISLDSLVDMAASLILEHSSEDDEELWASIIPSEQQWKSALEPILQLPPDASLAITSPLGNAVYAVNDNVSPEVSKALDVLPRDSNGYSAALRLTMYICKLMGKEQILEDISDEQRKALFVYYPIAIQLVDDNLNIARSNPLAESVSAKSEKDLMDTVSAGRWQISNFNDAIEGGDKMLAGFWEEQLQTLTGNYARSFHLARVYCDIMSNSIERTGVSKYADAWPTQIRAIRTSPDVFISASFLSVFKTHLAATPQGNRLCNELVSEVTGLNLSKITDGLRKLVLLNILISGEDSVIEAVPTQRLMFLVKHVMKCLQTDDIPRGLVSSILELLTVVFPLIKDMYGSHWEETLDIIADLWSHDLASDYRLPELHFSLRLYARLMRMTRDEECNEDLKESWAEKSSRLAACMLRVLRSFDSFEIGLHQPRDIVVELLSRLISQLPQDSIGDDLTDYYHLLAAESTTIQRSAYGLLHWHVPAQQEQISFDAALEKKTARLPDELLSLVIDVPDLDNIFENSTEDATWIGVRRYLLSWKVIFDHFSNASLKVREDYVNHIKESKILEPLLEFTFEFLANGHDKLINVSKFSIDKFELDQSESSEKEAQWLAVHLYFLTLKYLPNHAKAWWIDSKKQIKGMIESWTQKYISPLIISSSFASVSEWMTTQDADEEHALSVKISPRSSELIASIPVDEEADPICIGITLPPEYPLQPAVVTGRFRVAVSEKTWRSWLLTIRGVIMFSNGSIVDGLLAFRKNVQGALKGQSECAICYSIISTDMQVPNKRCGTCKNMFHSGCLFKWFKSSNQSSCPLCRSSFNYS